MKEYYEQRMDQGKGMINRKLIKHKDYHSNIMQIEADRLTRKGFVIEFEKKIMKGWRCDVLAKKGEEMLIVECGTTGKNKQWLEKLKNVINCRNIKLLNVQSLYHYLDLFEVQDMRRAFVLGLTIEQYKEEERHRGF
jgi:hypothetical protein